MPSDDDMEPAEDVDLEQVLDDPHYMPGWNKLRDRCIPMSLSPEHDSGTNSKKLQC